MSSAAIGAQAWAGGDAGGSRQQARVATTISWRGPRWCGRRRMHMAVSDASTGAEVHAGFDFAFDNEAFSDRVLRIEIVGGGEVAPSSAADGPSRKRLREEGEGEDGKGCTLAGTPILQVKTMHVSSAILAAKSSFFFKLFSNGMKESGQRQATIRIADTEEKAFMELLRFMYSGKLTATSDPTLLLDILMGADKFEIVSCMKLCGQQLKDLPMTPESAVRCLDLPCSISMAPAITKAATKFLAETYKDFLSTKFQDELMRIPLDGIHAILSRNCVGIASEESIYNFMLRWARSQYPDSEERDKILSSRLLPLVPRVLSINAIQIDRPSCVINFTVKPEQCARLFPVGVMRSPPFHCAGHGFLLKAQCITEKDEIFALLVEMLEDKGPLRTVHYKLEAKARPSLEFVTLQSLTTTTDSTQAVGCRCLWSQFFTGKNALFIDDMLHLRFQVKITPKP